MKKIFNVIDFIVILFVCAIVVFIGVKVGVNYNGTGDGSTDIVDSKFPVKKVVYTVKIGEIIESTAKAIPASSELYDIYDFKLGKVISKKVQNSEVFKLRSDGQYVKTVNPGKFDVFLEVEAEATIKDEGYYVNKKVLMGAGSGATFKAKNVEFWGHIVDIIEK